MLKELLKREGFRSFFFVLIVALTLMGLGNGVGDGSYQVVFFSVGVVLLLAWLSHITRRVLFNRLDLQDIALEAIKHPLGAAIVFAAIVFFLTILVQAGVMLLR